MLSVAYSLDGRHITSGSDDRTIGIWDTETVTVAGAPLGQHITRVNSVACSSNEQFIIFAPADKTIRIWNAVSRLFEERTIDKVTSGIVNCLLQGSDCGVQHATWGHCKPREGHGITVAWRQTLQCPLPHCFLPYDSQHVSFPPLYYPEEIMYLNYLLKSSSTSSSFKPSSRRSLLCAPLVAPPICESCISLEKLVSSAFKFIRR